MNRIINFSAFTLGVILCMSFTQVLKVSRFQRDSIHVLQGPQKNDSSQIMK